jgi:hypothetical protein
LNAYLVTSKTGEVPGPEDSSAFLSADNLVIGSESPKPIGTQLRIAGGKGKFRDVRCNRKMTIAEMGPITFPFTSQVETLDFEMWRKFGELDK